MYKNIVEEGEITEETTELVAETIEPLTWLVLVGVLPNYVKCMLVFLTAPKVVRVCFLSHCSSLSISISQLN